MRTPEKKTKSNPRLNESPLKKSKLKDFEEDSYQFVPQAPKKNAQKNKNHLGLKMNVDGKEFAEFDMIDNESPHNRNWIFFDSDDDGNGGNLKAPVPLMQQSDQSPTDFKLRIKRPGAAVIANSASDPILGPDDDEDLL